jgi:hypothetical protein
MRFETEQEQDLDRHDDGAVKSYVSIGDVIVPPSPFSGSELTKKMVAEQIRERYGDEAAERFNPFMDCRTFNGWKEISWRVKRGEKSLRSITFVEIFDKQGNSVKKIPRTVHLFHYKQCEKV